MIAPLPLLDSFRRVHTDLRISVTDRCNIRCFYCMPNENVTFLPKSELLTFEEIAKFAELARQHSQDPGSGEKGGDLGTFSRDMMVKPFADALAKLEKGATTTEPVQTEYGFHVIRLEDVRAPSAPGFEDVKEQVKMFAQRKKLQAYLDDLRKTAKIQKTD